MRNCTMIKEKLIEFIEGNLSDSENKEFQAHLDECQDCRALYTRFKAVYRVAAQPEEISPSPTFYARLQQRVDKYEEEKISLAEIWAYFTGRSRTVFTSAALLVAIFAGYMLGSGAMVQNHTATNTEETAFSEYFGVDYFDISSDLAIPEVYNQLINGEAQGE
jgi:anti-sigma factor RsiW